ncbi:MAG: RluA family pseudouridine synthase [Xanthomonadaceae bacterium]|nr:RluA family pseudouridine synthase [Xanthomonadaceae bacterium]
MTHSDPPEQASGPAADPVERKDARTVRIAEDRDGQRIDNFLLGYLKGAPRSLIYKLLRSGQVRLNGGRVKAERKLEAGDMVRIPPVRLDEPADKGTPARGLVEAMEASIVFEDARLLAINKPAGVASHGGSGIAFGAIETLRALRPRESLELVHRLDRDTSGLLLVARKRSALTELQALMREDGGRAGGIRKRYLALLVGRMPDGVMSVDAPLHVGLRQGGERHVQVTPGGKPSMSHFKVLERRGGQSYCEVRIETGRTHQIRVHAAHIDHAVAGDDKYGDEAANKRLRDQAGLKRMFLHASTLEFALDAGASPYLLNAPLPTELIEVLDRLA